MTVKAYFFCATSVFAKFHSRTLKKQVSSIIINITPKGNQNFYIISTNQDITINSESNAGGCVNETWTANKKSISELPG